MSASLAIWLAIFALLICAGLFEWARRCIARDNTAIEPVEHPEPPPRNIVVLADFAKPERETRP